MAYIERKRGDTYADEFTVKGANGQPLNITGCVFTMTLDPSRSPVDSTANLYRLTGVVTDAVNGKVEFAPSEEQANHVGSFYYDIEMVDGSGRKRTVLSDKYKYTQDITK